MYSLLKCQCRIYGKYFHKIFITRSWYFKKYVKLYIFFKVNVEHHFTYSYLSYLDAAFRINHIKTSHICNMIYIVNIVGQYFLLQDTGTTIFFVYVHRFISNGENKILWQWQENMFSLEILRVLKIFRESVVLV